MKNRKNLKKNFIYSLEIFFGERNEIVKKKADERKLLLLHKNASLFSSWQVIKKY